VFYDLGLSSWLKVKSRVYIISHPVSGYLIILSILCNKTEQVNITILFDPHDN